MAAEQNSGGFTYDPVTGTPVDKATADNVQSRFLEIKQDSTKAVADSDNAVRRVSYLEANANMAPGTATDETMATHAAQEGGLFNSELNIQVSDSVAERVPLELAASSAPAQAAAAAAATAVDAQLGAIKPIFDRSTNLFAQDTGYWNLGFPAGGASPAFSGTNGVSDYIGVTAGSTYVFGGGISRITWFDSAKAYLSDSGGIAQASTRVAPAGAFYARVTLPMTSFGVGQMNEGAVLLAYEEGRQTKVTPAAAPDVVNLSPDRTTFFDLSTNLFELATVTEGKAISAGQGNLVDNSTHVVSDWISMEPLADYTVPSGLLRITYYDVARQYLADLSFPAGQQVTFTTPPRTMWARITVSTAVMATAQMNAGVILLPFDAGGARIKPERLPTPGPGPTPGATTRPVVDAEIDGLWQASAPVAESSFISASTPQTVYDAYDALVAAHPTYVTRTQPGTATGGTLPIYAYEFSQTGPSNTAPGLAPTPRAKVILVTATHGNERAGVWSTYEMIKRMCESWEADPIIAALRYNLDLIVVPVANPTGYRDNTRQTATGVDPARNWPTGWAATEPGTPTYSGTAPMSEPETQAMDVVLKAHPDAIAVIDFHNFHTPANDYDFLYGTPATVRSAEVIDATIRRMDRAWKADEPTIVNQDPDVYIGYLSGAPAGSLGPESAARGHDVGMTFEMCWKVPTEPGAPTYSSLAMTWGMEALVNLLTISLRSA